jgi:hypothetical protein
MLISKAQADNRTPIFEAWNEDLWMLSFQKPTQKFQMLTSKARSDDKTLISKTSKENLWRLFFTKSLRVRKQRSTGAPLEAPITKMEIKP